jgi:hypothetical protein
MRRGFIVFIRFSVESMTKKIKSPFYPVKDFFIIAWGDHFPECFSWDGKT